MRRAAALALLPLALPALGVFDPPHGGAPRTVKADGAVVLSGDVDYLRVKRAAELYRSGSVSALVLTGSGVGGDSAAEMRLEALKAGVPPEAILLEERSKTTRENLLLAAPLVRAQRWRRVALVTSASHIGRAERAARRVMPDVDWVAIAVEDAGPPRRIYQTRLAEWAKLFYYAARGWI